MAYALATGFFRGLTPDFCVGSGNAGEKLESPDTANGER
jgi:hypothetical protein